MRRRSSPIHGTACAAARMLWASAAVEQAGDSSFEERTSGRGQGAAACDNSHASASLVAGSASTW
ncbi:hypothetical protein [Streptomyces sp. NPDC058872]|uniref:hypothetical protein n=1 Tax=Streptomyces sp. NPDC058872 TaxID=3346661 RepID=UPI003674123C